MWNNAEQQISKEMQRFLDSMRQSYNYKDRTSSGIAHDGGVWLSMENERPDQDLDVENRNISKRCVVRYDDEDRVARYDFDREQWICCVRGVVLQDIKYFMQIPELVED